MSLINLNGWVLIGPGSEWFWTAFSGLALAVTFIAIYRQLRLQRAAAAIEQMDSLQQAWMSEETARALLRILETLRDDPHGTEWPLGGGYVGGFWEKVGLLVRSGHLDRRLTNEYFSDSIRFCWATLEPRVRHDRVERGSPETLEHFEWLVGVMAELDRKAGRTVTYEQERVALELPKNIRDLDLTIRRYEELRAVIVRPMSTATLGPDPAPLEAA